MRLLFPVVAFLSAILVVAELCAVEGVFSAVGALVARAGRGSPRRMLALTFVAAALTTAALSLDATVVLLTPVVRRGRDGHAGQPAAGGLRLRPAGQLRLAAAAGLQPDQPARAARPARRCRSSGSRC